MLKFLVLFLALGALIPAYTHARSVPNSQDTPFKGFKNLLVFGDSLSDTGNLLVAPITNAVQANGFFSQNKVSGKNFTKPEHPLVSDCYPTELPGKVNSGFGWSEYLLQIANQERATSNNAVVPSMFLRTSEVCRKSVQANGKDTVAINYAWAASKTFGNCTNLQEGDKGPCDMDSVTTSWEEARKVGLPFANAQLAAPVTVQLDFFMDDVKNGRFQPTGQDVYLMWSGSNDLAGDFMKLAQKNLTKSQMENAIKGIVVDIAAKNIANAKRLMDNPAAKTKTVYLINQYDPKPTPHAASIPGAQFFGELMAKLYDSSLSTQVNAYNLVNPSTKIYTISAWDFFKQIFSENPQYFQKANLTSGVPKACPLPIVDPTEFKENCFGYAYSYLGQHPTSTTHQQFAVKMFEFLKNNPLHS